jgi:hypothetical protein
MNPRKETTIKDETEKLLKDGFIYPVSLKKWMSNLVQVNKKQGIIRVFMDFWDLNKSHPKHNFPRPFINQILDECAGSKIFSFMDGFWGITRSKFD